MIDETGHETSAADGHRRPRSDDARSLAQRFGDVAEGLTSELAERLRQALVDATGASLDLGRALFGPPRDPRLAREAGASLRELRELAGLTREELADAIRLQDRTLLQAVEEGTATLSFELVLRLAAILARHDPVPFLIRFTRTYNPEVWRLLEGFGLGRLPLHYEREREFVNIYRSHDAARQLSDEGFARVLAFTRRAFELALHFAAENELPEGETRRRLRMDGRGEAVEDDTDAKSGTSATDGISRKPTASAEPVR